jgi:RecG-like helicase
MNHANVVGTITDDRWTYGGDTLFRLRHGDGAAYFTIRFRNMPVDLSPGTRVVVSGELMSRDQDVTLQDFIGRAAKDDAEINEELVEQLAKQLRPVFRSYTEILVKEVRRLS